MNKSISRRLPRRGLLWKRSRGQSIAEFGYILPILAILLVASSDFARVFFLSIAVNNAARAGAQYGSQSVQNAANTAAMKAAAVNDGSNVPGLTASAKQCTCATGSQVTSCGSATSTYCVGNGNATYVTVTTSATFATLLNLSFAGLPNSFTLNGQAIMQVQE
ncbi:MAG: TadE/TadG family type IV pilus assembly protein [Candidatus Binatus sp.]